MPGRTVRARIDLLTTVCQVTVKARWDRQPVAEAAVAVLGQPNTLRYVHGGGAPRSAAR